MAIKGEEFIPVAEVGQSGSDFVPVAEVPPTPQVSPWAGSIRENVVKPLGFALGGAGGGLLGSAAGGLGAIPGGIAGATLGGAGLPQIYDRVTDLLGITKPKPTLDIFKQVGQEGAEAGLSQMTGEIIGPTISWLSGAYKGADALIRRGIEKAIRPSVFGKGTYKLSERYMDKAIQAVKVIADNKATLTLTDEIGNPIVGELPKNLKQFSQSIDQMKGKVFSEYDAMTKGANKATIRLDPIVKELDVISCSNAVIDNAPEVAKYAAQRGAALTGRGSYTAQEAQDAIAILNKRTEAFNKNPSFENATLVQVDALVANHMRRGLDNAIEGAVGEGYQSLKNTYGALKAIEKDVNHRSIIDARKNIKGLIDFSDILSGSEVVRGVLSMNPATIGKGAAAKVIASVYKHINDPNRIIEKMFEGVSSAGQSRISKETGKAIGKIGAYSWLKPSMTANDLQQQAEQP